MTPLALISMIAECYCVESSFERLVLAEGVRALTLTSSWVSVQLPASFFAYRKQQHRWTCGPVQLWRRCAKDIWKSSLPMSAKLELLLLYFGIRKFATHWVSLGFFCTLVPLSIFTPEVRSRQPLPYPLLCTGHIACSATIAVVQGAYMKAQTSCACAIGCERSLKSC